MRCKLLINFLSSSSNLVKYNTWILRTLDRKKLFEVRGWNRYSRFGLSATGRTKVQARGTAGSIWKILKQRLTCITFYFFFEFFKKGKRFIQEQIKLNEFLFTRVKNNKINISFHNNAIKINLITPIIWYYISCCTCNMTYFIVSTVNILDYINK